MAVVARTYAQALFDSAKEQGRLDEVRDGAPGVRRRRCTRCPSCGALLRNPQLDPTAKAEALAAVMEGADELVRNFFRLVAEKGRAQLIEEIVGEYEELVAAEEQILKVELTTAFELCDEEATSIVEQIEKRLRQARRSHALRRSRPRSAASSSRPARSRSTRACAAVLTVYDTNSSKEPARESPPRRDHLDPAQADRALRRRDRPRRGRHRPPGRRRHRPRLRPRVGRRDGDARVRARRHRPRLQPRGGQRRLRPLRRMGPDQGGRFREANGPRRQRSRRRGADRAHRRSAREPAGRRPADRDGRAARARDQGAGRHRPPAGQGAAPDRHQGDRRDDERRPRPARADHRRPLDGQDGDPRRHDPEPARPGRDLHLRRDRPEGLDRRADLRAPEGPGRDGVHDHRHGARLRGRSDQVDGALRGLRDGRVLHEQGRPRARHVRRPLEARRRLPADVAAPPAPARPRGLPRRRLLPPLAPARAREQALRRARRRLADGAAGGRDAGRRHRRRTSRRT